MEHLSLTYQPKDPIVEILMLAARRGFELLSQHEQQADTLQCSEQKAECGSIALEEEGPK